MNVLENPSQSLDLNQTVLLLRDLKDVHVGKPSNVSEGITNIAVLAAKGGIASYQVQGVITLYTVQR